MTQLSMALLSTGKADLLITSPLFFHLISQLAEGSDRILEDDRSLQTGYIFFYQAADAC